MKDISKEIYEEELQKINKMSEEDSQKHCNEILNAEGDDIDTALSASLIEGNLFRVYDAVSVLKSDAIPASDLIQEGNLALVLAVNSIKTDYDSKVSFGAYLDRKIIQGLTSFIEQEAESARASEELKARLNVIDVLCTKIAEEEGREATVEELSEKLNMEPSDVKYLMRIAISALEKED